MYELAIITHLRSMLVKCNYSDKLHLCTSQGHQFNAGHQWKDRLTEALISSIPENSKLRGLFVRWCTLNQDQRTSIDDNVSVRGRFDLYGPLKKALGRWEAIQDTQGAPGFDAGLYIFTCDSQLEEQLSNIICKVESIIDRLVDLSEEKAEKCAQLCKE